MNGYDCALLGHGQSGKAISARDLERAVRKTLKTIVALFICFCPEYVTLRGGERLALHHQSRQRFACLGFVDLSGHGARTVGRRGRALGRLAFRSTDFRFTMGQVFRPLRRLASCDVFDCLTARGRSDLRLWTCWTNRRQLPDQEPECKKNYGG